MNSKAQVDVLESFIAIDGTIEVALDSPSLDYPIIEVELKVTVGLKFTTHGPTLA